ncbi:hypothetical protein ACI2KR_08240 [Pseudomonas luteola]
MTLDEVLALKKNDVVYYCRKEWTVTGFQTILEGIREPILTDADGVEFSSGVYAAHLISATPQGVGLKSSKDSNKASKAAVQKSDDAQASEDNSASSGESTDEEAVTKTSSLADLLPPEAPDPISSTQAPVQKKLKITISKKSKSQ